jgi:UPF0716 protein FxsA
MPILVPFVLLPLIEIALFVVVGGWIGVWATLALVVATTLGGTLVLRGLGRQAVDDLRRGAGRGVAPGDMAIKALAGMLLILPGFLTDSIGLLLLVPPLRRMLVARLAARMTVVRPAQDRPADVVIEGEYRRVDPDAPPSGWTRH